ncbi:MAG TPA: DUF1259 domain-containing protein [Gemmatimonadaceae bacterium]|nr:DUF1259 domain-containing protein [Gemmatimonadaceae bacterium]
MSISTSSRITRALAAVLSMGIVVAPTVSAQQPSNQWSGAESAFGRKGVPQPADVMRFNFPRSDLTVRIGDVTLKPALALGSWVAFLPTGPGKALAMGDLVLLDNEVGPVMAALQAEGIEQTAVHNHLLSESPHITYMHVMAEGDPAKIAAAVHAALAKSATPIGAAPPGGAPAAELDTGAIAKALGVSGRLNGNVYQVSVPRSETIMEMGHSLPPSMGVATAINFQPTGAGKAAITGDFVLRGSEVNPVIRAFKKNGIDATALHSHLIDSDPQLYFMHFWANDDALKLARGLREALDQTKSKP